MDLNRVYDKINDKNIKIFPFGVDGIKAVTIETEGEYGIFINHKEIKDSDEEFCVLTHEYGHGTSGATHKLYSPYDVIYRHEYRADRRAILDFLPIEQLKNAINSGCKTAHEISVHLDMPELFINKAITHYKRMNLI